MNKRIVKILKQNKIKVFKVDDIEVINNGVDILYIKDKQFRIIGKIDLTMKMISGKYFKNFKIKRIK